jgi:superfamily II DNA/RNA helicase
VLAHVRELAQQIADVYSALTKNTEIQVSNFTVTGKCEGCQVVVSTIGKIQNDFKSRKPQIDLSQLKCIVIDEADFFFQKKEEIDAIKEIDSKHIKKLP